MSLPPVFNCVFHYYLLLAQFWCILGTCRVMYKHFLRVKEIKSLNDFLIGIRSWLDNPEIITLSQTTVWCTLTMHAFWPLLLPSLGNMAIYIRTLKTWLRILIQFLFLMSLYWLKLFLTMNLFVFLHNILSESEFH